MPITIGEAEQSIACSPVGHLLVRIDRGRRRRNGRRGSRSDRSEGITTMPQEIVILECTEAKALGKPVSRYMTTRNKKSPRTPNRLEKKKYNPFLKRRTLHRETK